METVVRQPDSLQQDSLKDLAQRLQDQLAGHDVDHDLESLLPSIHYRINCAMKQDSLLILCQHTAEAAVNPPRVFSILEQTIETLPPNLVRQVFDLHRLPCRYPVRIYLRRIGSDRPYAGHRFDFVPVVLNESDRWGSSPNPPDSFESRISGRSSLEDSPDLPVNEAGQPIDASEVTAAEFDATQIAADHDRPDKSMEIPSHDAPAMEVADGELMDAEGGVSPSSSSSELAPYSESIVPVSPASDTSEKLPWRWLAAVAGGSALAGAVFVASQPCLIGSTCQPIGQAETFSQQFAQAVKTAKSGNELLEARKSLTKASQSVSRVSQWSSQRDRAQRLLQVYQYQDAEVEQAVKALEKAFVANEATKAGTQKPEQLKRVRGLWQEAITQMQGIPSTSPVFPFAERQIVDFQDTLTAIVQKTTKDNLAQKKLANAKAVVQLAETRQSQAQSPDNWKLVQATWEYALKLLDQIPNGTSSAPEAQQLRPTYEQKLATVKERRQKDEKASEVYTKAIALADQARKQEQEKNWTGAISTWQQAIDATKQVPEKTFYYDQVQPLISSYGDALKGAQEKAQQAVKLQKTREELEKVCAGSPKICSYTVTEELVKLQLTPAYEKALQTALVAGQKNAGTLDGTYNHLGTLEKALQTVASNSQMPIEIYNSSNTEIVGSFNPGG